ncbi:uncharacterized protein LOC135479574 [Liolophura sinensis]|uniref:uncharacterized protein LOC135479574 n=1 Tax=Liolophura sinensis TaxID=3198878 RepID=UPI0031583492
MGGNLHQARKEAMWGMFVADALSMPVHWYYTPEDIKSGYGGWLTGYRAPNKRHPHCILSLSSTGGSGRSGWGSKSKPLIGSVILHDKLKYWTSADTSTHYHQGMKAGESTLNSMVALQILTTMHRVDPDCTHADDTVRAAVLEDYVKFMTTPGSHNDTYAESFHRAFFKDWAVTDPQPRSGADVLKFAEDRSAKKMKGIEDHQLSVVGALVPALPWILRSAGKSEDECVKSTVDFVKLTHPVPSLFPYVEIYARLLHRVLHGKDLREEVKWALERKELGGSDKYKMVHGLKEKADGYRKDSEERLRIHQQATSMLGSACYIEGALSSLLYLALNYADDFDGGVLANANCGGENCHRGSALGALLGAARGASGQPITQKWKDGLTTAKEGLIHLSKPI